MTSILIRSALSAVVSTVASVSIAAVGLAIMEQELVPSAIVLSIVIPILVSFPVSAFIFKKVDENVHLHSKLSKAYSELALLHERLSEPSRRDGMTGVLNRDAFMKQMEELHAENSSGVLLLIDADFFKLINDQFGDAAGDEALVAISQAIGAAVRGQDIVGRLGGEEFGIFLKGTSHAETNIISERIRAAVQAIDFCPRENHRHALSVSIGGKTVTQPIALQNLMKHADELLYKAKSQGRNKVMLEAA